MVNGTEECDPPCFHSWSNKCSGSWQDRVYNLNGHSAAEAASKANGNSVGGWIFGGADATFFIISGRRDAHPEEFAADIRELVKLAASGALEVVVGKVWRFEEEVEALRSIETGAHRGKQVVVVGGPITS
jgi:NADPH:quinone reductase-like Zn-dependent oxidoreductase